MNRGTNRKRGDHHGHVPIATDTCPPRLRGIDRHRHASAAMSAAGNRALHSTPRPVLKGADGHDRRRSQSTASMMNRRLIIGAGLVLSAVCLYFAARGARLDRMIETLRGARWLYMIPCVVLTLLAFWIRALRWRFLLHGVRPIPQGTLFSATMIGFFANNLLPARMGELVRAMVVGRNALISRSAALASIVVERIFDLFTVLGLFAVVALFSRFPGGLGSVALLVLMIGLAILGVLMIWNRHPERFLDLALRVVPGSLRDRFASAGTGFREGLRVLNRAPHLLIVAALSLVMWAAIVAVVWLCISSLSIGVPQPEASIVALVAIALVTMAPSAPGFVGTLQGAGTAALLVFGVRKELGLTFSIVYHATQWFPVNIVGAVYLFREGLNLGQLSKMVSANAPDRDSTEAEAPGARDTGEHPRPQNAER